MTKRNCLRNIEQICEVGGFSKPQFYRFVDIGLPARKIFGNWMASRKNIELFIQKLTSRPGPEITEENIPKKRLSR